MGKRNEDGSSYEEYPDGKPDESTPDFLSIEEHAKQEAVSAPIFAAVKVMKGWNAGKKVHSHEFKEAVTAFLGSPIGGR